MPQWSEVLKEYASRLDYFFSVGLPDYIRIFEGMMMTMMILSLRKVSAGFKKVVIISGSQSVCGTLYRRMKSENFTKFCAALPKYI